MARVLENIGKELLKNNGILVPEFCVANSPKEARTAAERIGFPVVIKALITVGKRGKSGAVKFADSPEEAERIAGEILSMTVRNFPVDKLLVEKKLNIAKELYVSLTYDSVHMGPVIIASSEGGVDIEEIARSYPEKILKHQINILDGFHNYQSKEIWSQLGVKGKLLQKATIVLSQLYNIFIKYDATVLEINPLVITTDGNVAAAAILMGVNDDAFFRQPELAGRVEVGNDGLWRPLTELEKQMIEVDKTEAYRGTARYTEMEGGDIGFFCGGGGGSLISYDALLRFGGKPANYTEFGGNPPENKVKGLVKGVMSKPGVKGFYMNMNITNNTQADVVAKGIVGAFKELSLNPAEFPVFVRLAGVNDLEARDICVKAGIEYHGDDISMEDAAQIIAEKMRKAYSKEAK